jgi:Mrr N-terminal domain
MKRTPHSAGVTQAMRSVRTAAQKSLKGLNQIASKQMAKGDYAAAETLAAKGREIRQFQSEIDALIRRWREVCSLGRSPAKQSNTPLWVYFQPILQALVRAGGECRRADLEARVEGLISASPAERDLRAWPASRDQWRLMIQRARRHLVNEGWIENRPGPIWRITEAGRKAAEKPATERALS